MTESEVRTHYVKCWPSYFDAIARGIKPFDVRRDDRGYQRGDILVLQCWCPRAGHYVSLPTGERIEIRRLITYVLPGGQFGVEAGFAVLGLAETPPAQSYTIRMLATRGGPAVATEASLVGLGIVSPGVAPE